MYNCRVSQKDFEDLIVAAKHTSFTGFISYCTVLTDEECDFGDRLDDATFSYLYLYNMGQQQYSNWADHPHRLENIIKGLGKSKGVRDHLKTLDLLNSGLDKDRVQQMLNDNSLGSVDIKNI